MLSKNGACLSLTTEETGLFFATSLTYPFDRDTFILVSRSRMIAITNELTNESGETLEWETEAMK